MNGELFHDALDLLDDDLIEPVDALRSKRKSHMGVWSAAIAACLCLVLVGAWLLRSQPSTPSTTGEHLDGNGGYDGLVAPGDNGNSTDGLTYGDLLIRLPARVDILVWRSDGFAGVLMEDWNGLSAGRLVTVKISEPVDIPAGSQVLVWAESREGNVFYAKKIERMG